MSIALLALALAGCTPPPEFEVRDALVRELIPGRNTTAGYFVLKNNTTTPVSLIGAHSRYARAIEMHQTYTHDDRVRMRRVNEYTIEPGEQVVFAPGGLHLMIFGVKQLPEPFPITLTLRLPEQAGSDRQIDVSFSKLPR